MDDVKQGPQAIPAGEQNNGVCECGAALFAAANEILRTNDLDIFDEEHRAVSALDLAKRYRYESDPSQRWERGRGVFDPDATYDLDD